jgi:spermidine/putrescine transport system substrate-binding protein
MLGLLASAALAGCTGGGTDETSTPGPPARPSPTQAAGDGTITWATWEDYIDVAEHGRRRPTLEAFVRRSGIPVDYQEVINDNDQFVNSIGTALAQARPVGYDVVTLTSWMAARTVEEGWMQPFGPVENVGNLIPALAAPDWDPDQTYSMPWQAGLTGIAYDARRVDRAIGSVAELFTRADLKGQVGLLTEFTDTVGLTMLARGAAMTGPNVRAVEEAVEFLGEQTDRDWFAHYYGNEYIDALGAGDIPVSVAWSGDVLQAQLRNPYLKFVIPEEGLMIWADNLLVPVASGDASEVAKLAAYFYQPRVAAEVAAWVNYICPVTGAQAEMDRIDPNLALSPLIFPDQTILDQSYQFPTLPAADDGRLRARFAEIAASK